MTMSFCETPSQVPQGSLGVNSAEFSGGSRVDSTFRSYSEHLVAGGVGDPTMDALLT